MYTLGDTITVYDTLSGNPRKSLWYVNKNRTVVQQQTKLAMKRI
jgi:hypothetical protein